MRGGDNEEEGRWGEDNEEEGRWGGEGEARGGVFKVKEMLNCIPLAITEENLLHLYSYMENLFEAFFATHANLVEAVNAPLRRALMDELSPADRLIGIKGTRGVGKTTFLLQFAKEHYGAHDRRCLYVNMNNFYFSHHSLADFAGAFVAGGGQCLLIDQVFKHPRWSGELRQCYDRYPSLRIIFTGSSVMHLDAENAEIGGIVKGYNLRGFSFREYLNLTSGNAFTAYSLDDILAHHEAIAKSILPYASPQKYFPAYLHHGFYPFHLEHRDFSENLLKTMNMMAEVDILLIEQMEQKYLARIKELFYLLALSGAKAPNISAMAQEIGTSRATVMNYIKYLAEARLINIIYPAGESVLKKPSKVMLHNPNLLYAIYPIQHSPQEVMETFLVNTLWKDHNVRYTNRDPYYTIDGTLHLRVCDANDDATVRYADDCLYARYNTEVGRGNKIPLWLFGFLY